MSIKIFGAELENPARMVGQYGHAEGYNTLAAGQASHAEGYAAYAASAYGHAEGYSTTTSAPAAHAEGYGSTASGTYSHAGGFNGKADAHGAFARGFSGLSTVNASRAQTTRYTAGARTTSTTTAWLTFDGATGVTTTPGAACNVLAVAPYSAFLFEVRTVARRAGVGGTQGWLHSGLIYRDSSASSLAGTVTQLGTWVSGAGFGTIIIYGHNNYVQIGVTADAATATVWLATLTATELTLPS